MPIDINWIRPDRGGNPDMVRESEERRGRDPKIVDTILEIDEKWRKEIYNLEGMKKNINEINKRVADRKKKNRSDPCEAEVSEMSKLKVSIQQQEKAVDEISMSRDKLLHNIGNIVHDTVPISKTEDDNKVIRRWGIPNRMKIDGTPGRMFHHQVLEKLRGYEPKKGAMVAGHRGYYLRGVGVLLNMALQQYGVNFLCRKGYLPIQPPYFMKKEIMAETAELKDFEETLYKIPGTDSKEDMFLIATSEQPISALHKGDFLEEKELPIKYAGISSCFRKEAGAHGKDTWGIFRIHQFEKVEQFVLTTPEDSWRAHEEMIAACEEFYQSLDLPYQVIAIVSGALNDAAAKKYDLEAWFPGYEAYRELVSCSNCTDYQSRAMETRLGHKKQGDREKKYVHMLNATMVATERCLCCILENYQTAEGVRVPRVLVPYMGGLEFLKYPEDDGKDKEDKEDKKDVKKETKKENAQANGDKSPRSPNKK